MHCPQCGQQQVSSELRFCSRCGFPMSGVGELVASGGVIPQSQPPTDAPKISPRRKGVQQGVALIFLAVVLTPLFAVLNNYLNFPEIFAALTAIIGFIGGPLRILYAAIFEEGAQRIVYVNSHQQQPGFPVYHSPPPPPRAMGDINRGNALPPQQSVPVSNWRRRPDTAELAQPPSVTENTTRLLDKRESNEEPPVQ